MSGDFGEILTLFFLNSECEAKTVPIAYSGPNLPPVPDEACHPFRLKTATHSGRNLPL
jgi:hypothetical protein